MNNFGTYSNGTVTGNPNETSANPVNGNTPNFATSPTGQAFIPGIGLVPVWNTTGSNTNQAYNPTGTRHVNQPTVQQASFPAQTFAPQFTPFNYGTNWNTPFNTPFNYGTNWNTPFNTPFNYGTNWNTPFNTPFNYGTNWNTPFNTPFNYGTNWNTPFNTPFNYGANWNTPFNTPFNYGTNWQNTVNTGTNVWPFGAPAAWNYAGAFSPFFTPAFNWNVGPFPFAPNCNQNIEATDKARLNREAA
ncbi:MAG: hypothetical protein JNK25_14875 [Phycisphaerae bacterium]|nr:hypothetical protein [Phycisphaerae bacterium]